MGEVLNTCKPALQEFTGWCPNSRICLSCGVQDQARVGRQSIPSLTLLFNNNNYNNNNNNNNSNNNNNNKKGAESLRSRDET